MLSFDVINRYTIEELEVKYLVNMKVEVCLEHGKPCLISYDIAKNLYLPKIGCDWSFNYSGVFLLISIFKMITTESIKLSTNLT